MNFISVQEAKFLILNQVDHPKPVAVHLDQATGKILAEDILSPLDLPPFPQSSMDGYAFRADSYDPGKGLLITEVIPAGQGREILIGKGEAVRIFTGAAVPQGADTVIMQEKTEVRDGRLYLKEEVPPPGTHVRPAGSEIRKGEQALPTGHLLNPASIGLLASMGLTSVAVHTPPSVHILVTGDELTSPGEPLPYGRVFDSNSFTLRAAFQLAGIEDIRISQVPDREDLLSEAISSALEKQDLVVLTGGVSVGDFDFVAATAMRCGVEKVFHKIKQKPGKPIFFGIKGNKLVFGLPGNPASALTCFYEYLEPAVQKLLGKSSAVRKVNAPIQSSYKKAPGLTHFLKAWYDGSRVFPLDAQESFRLRSFARANALIVIDEKDDGVQAGEQVEVHILPV
ncbi:MAG TPA: molybdopterin molybdotransferase MoeA [Saprospiraceae bacterium]|nr:molybdopterin molybdotransferase MoeA [Saprospiraceae bacterium]HNT20731.1 molybdopterin molybdotransferase MoeA [Saprospiraceae bacterium]